MNGFLPNKKNLGGKKIIDSHKSNHIISVLNASPLVNSLKKPHPHVSETQINKKKSIEVSDYFREVNEAYRRVNNLKHGYVDHSRPKTFHLKNSISKRVVYEKNIILHDHMRNIAHLGNSIKLISKISEKKIENIKAVAQTSYSNQKTKSVDFLFANNLLDNFNPFAKNDNLYDSADYSFINSDRIIGISGKKSKLPSNGNFTNKKSLEPENESKFIKFEREENQYEPTKKKIIEFIVKNKLYEKKEVINLKEKILIGNYDLDKGMVEEIFEQIIQYFFK